jgi:hypothetical protein
MLKYLMLVIPLAFFTTLLSCQMSPNNNTIVIRSLQNADRSVRTLNFLDSSRIIVGGDVTNNEAILEQRYWLQTCYTVKESGGKWQFTTIGSGRLVKIRNYNGRLFALTILGIGDMVSDTTILYQSDDEGTSWTEFSRVPCYGIDFLISRDYQSVYVWGRDNPEIAIWQVLFTNDMGKTWNKIISNNADRIAGHIYKGKFYLFSYLDDACSIASYENGKLINENQKIASLKRYTVKAVKGINNNFYFSGQSKDDSSTAIVYKYDFEKDSLQIIWQKQGYSILSIDAHDELIALYLAKADGIALENRIVYTRDGGHLWSDIILDGAQFNPNALSEKKIIGHTGFGSFKYYNIP